jgi:hypothetical protein
MARLMAYFRRVHLTIISENLSERLAQTVRNMTDVDINIILGVTGSANADWRGRQVDSTAVLVRFTYAGDANLDGAISGDDYSTIDFNINLPNATGFAAGDFNFDGVVSGDDYTVIDFNMISQGNHGYLFTTGSVDRLKLALRFQPILNRVQVSAFAISPLYDRGLDRTALGLNSTLWF